MRSAACFFRLASCGKPALDRGAFISHDWNAAAPDLPLAANAVFGIAPHCLVRSHAAVATGESRIKEPTRKDGNLPVSAIL